MGIQIGKLGPAVGSMWKGKNVYRSYNPFVKNPRTSEQQKQRTKFALLSNLARVFSPASNFGFAYKANSERIAQRSVFMKVNKDALTYNEPGFNINWDQIQCADGPVTAAVFGTPTFANGKITIPVTSTMEGVGLALDNDRISLLAVLPNNGVSLFAEVDRAGRHGLRNGNRVVGVVAGLAGLRPEILNITFAGNSRDKRGLHLEAAVVGCNGNSHFFSMFDMCLGW